MNIQIFSPGGSGSCFCSCFLTKYANYHKEKYTHHKKPIEIYLKINKIIYLYSDPRNSLLSFHKRNLIKPGWAAEHAIMSGVKMKIPDSITLDELIDQNIYGVMKKNFYSWLNFNHPNLLFTKYEYLSDNIEKILDFLEVKNPDLSKFANKLHRKQIGIFFKKNYINRKSNYKDLDKSMQIKITNYFQDILNTQSKLDSFYIRNQN